MSDNDKRIKKVFKLVNQFSKLKNKLEKALEKLEWPMEIFFISLTNEIIMELEKINTSDQNIKTHKRIASNISNNNIYLEKAGKTYLYNMINVFDEIKIYKKKFSKEIIEYIITPENIQKILQILMATNKIISANQNVIKERNEFNSYIMNLLINIINLNNKILIDVLSTQSQFNVFYQLFTLFSKNEENRNLLYELERNIFMYYPENKNLKELINYTIDCIDEDLNIDNCKNTINEIKKILFLYKNEINIINKMMTKLIIKIFSLFENENEKHYLINDFLKFCFNEISFDGNNKFYSRYIFKGTNKSRTLVIRNSNLTIEKLPENKKNEQSFDDDKIDSSNSNSIINNLLRGNTVTYNSSKEFEKQLDNNENIDLSISENNNNKINNNHKEEEDDNNNNNKNQGHIVHLEEDKNNVYNPEFINFLFDIYNEFVNLKMKNSYNIFFIELFLSINNSFEGKNEYLFLIKKTNYIKVILSSLFKLKDESLIAAYFSKIMSLSIPENKKGINNENECYIPEFDLNFIINNINLFLNEKESDKILNVISSQIISLIKMNNNLIEFILNKCNIFESFISILNNEAYKNETKKIIILLLENILEINNNKYKYSLKMPIISYNISDNFLIKKIYIISLMFENNISELNYKIILIVNYMENLFKENKIQELIIFYDILLEGIYKNIINISNYKIIDDETINRINTLLYNISNISTSEFIANYKSYEELFFILLKFQYNYNKKYFIYYLNKIPNDNKNKIIIEENIIYTLINNFLINENDLNTKNNLLKSILIYCLDINDNITQINNNNFMENNDDNTINNYLLKNGNFLVKVLNILFEIKDYQCLNFLISKIIILIKKSLLNIKIFMNNKKFIQIIIKLLIILCKDKNEDNLISNLKMILSEISKYLSETLLIEYLNEIYLIFYTTISNNENNREKDKENQISNNKEIILELFNILKNGIINSRKNNYDFLSLSNFCFYNPFIYNLLYIKEINFDEAINQYLCLDINIRISTFNNIGIFNLVEFINLDTGINLSFYINNKKNFIIS